MESFQSFILDNWVGWLFSLLSVIVGYLYSRFLIVMKKTTATEEGIRALLRNSIIKSYNSCRAKGYCPIYEMENVEEMYTQYHALGGNGTITELVERIRQLPTEPRVRTYAEEGGINETEH